VNLLKSPFRRTTAVLAGAFIGLAGAVAIAAPASAHHPEVSPESSCINADGSWTVKWTITNSEDDLEGTITSVRTLPRKSTITGIEEGDTLPKSVDGALHGGGRCQAGPRLPRNHGPLGARRQADRRVQHRHRAETDRRVWAGDAADYSSDHAAVHAAVHAPDHDSDHAPVVAAGLG
jgi:hypothetical protein